jgi:hypothetical protein
LHRYDCNTRAHVLNIAHGACVAAGSDPAVRPQDRPIHPNRKDCISTSLDELSNQIVLSLRELHIAANLDRTVHPAVINDQLAIYVKPGAIIRIGAKLVGATIDCDPTCRDNSKVVARNPSRPIQASIPIETVVEVKCVDAENG